MKPFDSAANFISVFVFFSLSLCPEADRPIVKSVFNLIPRFAVLGVHFSTTFVVISQHHGLLTF